MRKTKKVQARVMLRQEPEACCHYIFKACAFVVLFPWAGQQLARANPLDIWITQNLPFLGLRLEFLPWQPLCPSSHQPFPQSPHWSLAEPQASAHSHSLLLQPFRAGPKQQGPRTCHYTWQAETVCSLASLPHRSPGTHFQHPAVFSWSSGQECPLPGARNPSIVF